MTAATVMIVVGREWSCLEGFCATNLGRVGGGMEEVGGGMEGGGEGTNPGTTGVFVCRKLAARLLKS